MLQDAKNLKEWSGNRIKQNAKRQEELLVAAVDIVRVSLTSSLPRLGMCAEATAFSTTHAHIHISLCGSVNGRLVGGSCTAPARFPGTRMIA